MIDLGSVAQVEGGGFSPGVAVTLSWRTADGAETPAGVRRADPTGAVELPMLLLAHDAVGPRRLVAVSTEDGTVDAPALVVVGSTQPGRQDTLVTGRRGLIARR